MSRSSSSDSASRDSRSSRRDRGKPKKGKSERSRHRSRSADSYKKKSRSRSRERNRRRYKSRSRSPDRHGRSSRKEKSSRSSHRRRHSKSRKRSQSREYNKSRSRKSSASTAGSSAEDTTGSANPSSSDESSSRHSRRKSKYGPKMHSDVSKTRSSRESGITSRSTTAFNSREGSSGSDGNDNMAAKLSAAEIAAIAAEKALGMNPRETISGEPVDVVAKLRMDNAVRDIESSSFEPKTFTSSRNQQNAQQASKSDQSKAFQFGTSAEKAARENNGIGDKSMSNVMINIAGEGLCHSNLFGDPVKRDERWIDYLYNLQQTIYAEKRDESCVSILDTS